MGLPDKATYVDGGFCSDRVQQIIRAIKEYSIELDVQWIPPLARKPGEAAFRVVHRPMGREPYVIFTIKTEAEFTSDILMRIIQGDQRRNAVKYNDVEAAEEAARLIAKERARDELQETIDKMYYILKSPLNTYKVDKDFVVKDGIPFNAKLLPD